MDNIDRKILSILQKDASIRNVQLAEKVGLAPSSCLRRVAALKKNGTIRRIVALPHAEKIGLGVKAIVAIKLKEHDIRSIQATAKAFSDSGSVSQVYSISGETDLMVILSSSSLSFFESTMQNILQNTNNVEQYVTHFVVNEHKFEPSL